LLQLLLADAGLLRIQVPKKFRPFSQDRNGGSLLSAGRFDTFTRLNSSLSSDGVHAVAIQDELVWAPTRAGLSRLNKRTGECTLFNQRNTPMHEI
jgi:hypothetical protein